MQKHQPGSVFYVHVFFQSTPFFIGAFILFLILLLKLTTIIVNQDNIQTIEIILTGALQGISQALVDQQRCINITNLSIVRAAEFLYCNLSLPIANYTPDDLVYIDWIPALQDKIDRSIILYNAICIDSLVIHFLFNNPSVTFPVSSFIPNDPFLSGLPHMCIPGSNVGHSGVSQLFEDLVGGILVGSDIYNATPPLNAVLYYPPTSVSALIGSGFYLANDIFKCYKTELYCYGFTPAYLFFGSP